MATSKVTVKPFASGTQVAPQKTLLQIDALLEKAGAEQVNVFRTLSREGIAFVRENVTYRISIVRPMDEVEAKANTRGGRLAGHPDYMTAERARRLRVLLDVVQAKIRAVDENVYQWEEMFGFDAVTEDGQTVAERMVPQIKQAALNGHYPSALPMPGAQ